MSASVPPLEPVLVELDSRRRLSLGRIGRHDRYLVYEEPDGTLILAPAVVMTQTEAKLLARPDITSRIEEARTHPERRVPRRRRQERAQ